jgi:ubiquinone/menaquinone biosynthesis C-methylase UbiE
MSHSHTHGTPHEHAAGHTHGHTHAPDPAGAEDAFATANRAHFDEHAPMYDAPDKEELARRLLPHLLAAHPFDEDRTAMLDFACGTGLMSRALAAHTARIVGVDISQGMVDAYNARVALQGVPAEEMRAVVADLTGAAGELDDQKFDVALVRGPADADVRVVDSRCDSQCSMSYHHISDTAQTTRVLAHFLKPGGTLLVVDILTPEAEDPADPLFAEKYHAMVPHRHGFAERDMRKLFEGAGFGDFMFKVAEKAKIHEKPVTIFVARGVKPPTS